MSLEGSNISTRPGQRLQGAFFYIFSFSACIFASKNSIQFGSVANEKTSIPAIMAREQTLAFVNPEYFINASTFASASGVMSVTILIFLVVISSSIFTILFTFFETVNSGGDADFTVLSRTPALRTWAWIRKKKSADSAQVLRLCTCHLIAQEKAKSRLDRQVQIYYSAGLWV